MTQRMDVEGFEATFRPISEWPGEATRDRGRSRFKATWAQTLKLLKRELEYIIKRGATPVIEMALRESQIRVDGYPKANSTPEHPGVILSIDSRYGPLRYPCDTFDNWRDNMRAIALALEALRKVDRYGVTKRGEQYKGWKQLPPAGGSGVTMTTEDAAVVVQRTAGLADGDRWRKAIVDNHEMYRSAYRIAAKFAHPDGDTGSTNSFQVLQQAAKVLDAHHGVGEK